MSLDISRWRNEFLVSEEVVYFDHAGVAPVSKRVADAVTRFISEACARGRLNYRAWEERAEQTRAAFARLIGAAADEIAFVANTSEGLAVVATGLEWKAGDNVVAVSGEFPANVYPWWALERLGVETRMATLEDFRLTLAGLDRCVDGRTRLVSVSAVDFATGHRRSLKEIGRYCRERGIVFCVDAVQALGALRIDVEEEEIDCLAADGHKWLLAPEGCGCLYVARRLWDRLQPQRVGWKSVVDHSRYLPYHFTLKPNALKFEPGSLNLLSIHALGAALDLLLEVGIARIEEVLLGLTQKLRDGLAERNLPVLSPGGRDEISGITTFRGVARPGEVEEKLRERGIVVRERLGGLRVSPHFYCNDDDLSRFFRALEEVIGC